MMKLLICATAVVALAAIAGAGEFDDCDKQVLTDGQFDGFKFDSMPKGSNKKSQKVLKKLFNSKEKDGVRFSEDTNITITRDPAEQFNIMRIHMYVKNGELAKYIIVDGGEETVVKQKDLEVADSADVPPEGFKKVSHRIKKKMDALIVCLTKVPDTNPGKRRNPKLVVKGITVNACIV